MNNFAADFLLVVLLPSSSQVPFAEIWSINEITEIWLHGIGHHIETSSTMIYVNMSFFFFPPLNSIVSFLSSILSISSHVWLLKHIELTAYSWQPPALKLVIWSAQLFSRDSNASSSGIPATSGAVLSTQCLLSYIHIYPDVFVFWPPVHMKMKIKHPQSAFEDRCSLFSWGWKKCWHTINLDISGWCF